MPANSQVHQSAGAGVLPVPSSISDTLGSWELKSLLRSVQNAREPAMPRDLQEQQRLPSQVVHVYVPVCKMAIKKVNYASGE